jgi:hypothetical protein
LPVGEAKIQLALFKGGQKIKHGNAVAKVLKAQTTKVEITLKEIDDTGNLAIIVKDEKNSLCPAVRPQFECASPLFPQITVCSVTIGSTKLEKKVGFCHAKYEFHDFLCKSYVKITKADLERVSCISSRVAQ